VRQDAGRLPAKFAYNGCGSGLWASGMASRTSANPRIPDPAQWSQNVTNRRRQPARV